MRGSALALALALTGCAGDSDKSSAVKGRAAWCFGLFAYCGYVQIEGKTERSREAPDEPSGGGGGPGE